MATDCAEAFTQSYFIQKVDLNDEAGTVICEYPKEVYKPQIPIPYCEETMTGFEYAFAGMLIKHGKIEKGLQVIRSVRERYDGKKRNPYNELECGSNYARAMAAFAFLPIFSGFGYDLPKEYHKNMSEAVLWIEEGSLQLSSFGIDCSDIKTLEIDGKQVEFTCSEGKIHFEKHRILYMLKIIF